MQHVHSGFPVLEYNSSNTHAINQLNINFIQVFNENQLERDINGIINILISLIAQVFVVVVNLNLESLICFSSSGNGPFKGLQDKT